MEPPSTVSYYYTVSISTGGVPIRLRQQGVNMGIIQYWGTHKYSTAACSRRYMLTAGTPAGGGRADTPAGARL